jgi:hypothetical protein
MPAWLGQLAALAPREALQHLSDNIACVPDKLWALVEAEYNSGARLATTALVRLDAGELASKAAQIARKLAWSGQAHDIDILVPVAAPSSPKGYFFYIAAGIGSGIAEAQQVRGCSPLLLARDSVQDVL